MTSDNHDLEVDTIWKRFVDQMMLARHDYEMETRKIRDAERQADTKFSNVRDRATADRDIALKDIRSKRKNV